MKGDTRSLDYGSCGGSGVKVRGECGQQVLLVSCKAYRGRDSRFFSKDIAFGL